MEKQCVVKSEKLSTQCSPRYVIIDRLTGKIIDDAQGFGYGCQQKAGAALYQMKCAEKELLQKKRLIEEWKKTNREMVWLLKCLAFEIAQGKWGKEIIFDVHFVQKCLDINGYYELPFPLDDLMEHLR